MGLATDKLRFICKQAGITYVGTRGPVGAPLAIAGEAPGEEEDRQGLPFVGYSGKELDRMNADADISPNEVWFTNPYKVRPPENELERLAERGIPLEIYEAQFFEELEEAKPTFIVAAGATALGLLCPSTVEKRTGSATIGKWRGSLLTSPRLAWPHYVIPMHHPAFILREYSERQVGVFCLARAKEELDYFVKNGYPQPLPERELIVEPTFDDAVAFLMDLLASDLPVSVDIEMIRRRWPYTIALANSPWRAISICLWDYPTDQLIKIWRLLDAILWSKHLIGQNFTTFDAPWLQLLGFRPNIEKLDDTLIRHHVLWPELEHKLQFQVMQYTREPYFKDEGKSWSLKEGKAKLMRYNCKDATTTLEIFQRQEEEFAEKPELRRFYTEYEMPLARKMHYVDKRGVLMNQAALHELRQFIEAELEKECNSIAGKVGKSVASDKASAIVLAASLNVDAASVLNLNSSAQVIAALKARGLKVKKSRQTGRETSGEAQLQQMFAESGDDFIKGILSVRELNVHLHSSFIASLTQSQAAFASSPSC